MELIACAGCGYLVGAGASFCGRCGRALATSAPRRRGIVLPLVAAGILSAVLAGTALVVSRAADAPEAGLDRRGTTASVSGEAAPSPRPTDNTGTYTVGYGETIFSVANRFGVTRDELRAWNRDAYPSLDTTPDLQPGWVLRVAGPPLAAPTPLATLAPSTAPGPAARGPVMGLETEGLVALPVLTVEIANADIHYFAISGRTPGELFASIAESIPPSPDGEVHRDALAYVGPVTWHHDPDFALDPRSGACTLTGVDSSVRYEATIPQWRAPSSVSGAVLEWWTLVLEHIRWHEEQHVRIFTEYVSDLPRRVAGQPCDALEDIVAIWTAELRAAQNEFDAGDRWRPPSFHP